MREIKFRAWDEAERKMRFPNLIGKYGDAHTCWWTKDVSGHMDTKEIMQYTGLKDKNGKEIYEGDIVSGGRLNCNDGGSGFAISNDQSTVKFESGMFKAGSISLNSISRACEIIGNIYESPELLQQPTG